MTSTYTLIAENTHSLGTLTCRDITLRVPLTAEPTVDHRTIDVFARVATAPGGESRPYLLFLQGGPGNESPRPCLNPLEPTWLGAALERYQVVFLDQRGTGRSTPVTAHILDTDTPEHIAEYLTHLRADGIVRDAEAFRTYLNTPRWATLGQSFGGFCTLHYMTTHPESLLHCYFTGGLSAIGHSADDVYAECYNRMRQSTLHYYQRFPHHRDIVRRMVERARRGEIVLPSGEIVSESRFRSLGHVLGGDHGWLSLYNLLESSSAASEIREGLPEPTRNDAPETDAFLHDLEHLLPYGTRNPLYLVIHESSYADGVATHWAAMRTLPEDFREDTTLLTGEHVSRDWFDTVPAFRPWKAVADIIAEVSWPTLYDADRIHTAAVPGAAAVYANDVYVPLKYSLETAQNLPHVALYITSEHEHNGLRTGKDGEVLRHLMDIVSGARIR